MTIQTINVGSLANDGTGDDLREAFIKVNQNFAELDTRTEATTATNVGTSGANVFKELVGSELQFRKITGGNAITVTENTNEIEISSVAGQYILRDDYDTSHTTGAGTVLALKDTNAMRVRIDPNASPYPSVTFDSKLAYDPQPELYHNLNARNFDIFNVTNINNIDTAELEKAFGWDFGELDETRTSIFDWILNVFDVDLGEAADGDVRIPESRANVDFGTLGD